MSHSITIIGAGLSGCEAAWQAANLGVKVQLYEMRPVRSTKAHKTGDLAELVCSNSFRGADFTNAVGLLKEELRILNSLIMEGAIYARVPAGGALAVDRVVFSNYIQEKILSHPNIKVIREEITEMPNSDSKNPLVIATGPLTAPSLSKAIVELVGEEHLAFFDAISPIIHKDSIDFTKLFKQSRYDKGDGADYWNIPLTKEAYFEFIENISKAEKYGGHTEVESDSIENVRPFEGCMPIEEMVDRGPRTLAFGPMKPVGLTDPITGRRPYAVVQLRQDDKEGTLWSMVGFQTRMKHPEQQRVFRTLPGLENAEFVRLGTVHRNTFINSPSCLNNTLQFRTRPELFFAGQITGTEGYVEAAAGGLLAGINSAKFALNLPLISFPKETAIGGLIGYVSDPERKYFQPMNVSFGLMAQLEGEEYSKKRMDKKQKRTLIAERALAIIRECI